MVVKTIRVRTSLIGGYGVQLVLERPCLWPLVCYCKSMSISHIIYQRRILFILQASWHVLLQLLASLSINEHIADCGRYGISTENVSTDFVK